MDRKYALIPAYEPDGRLLELIEDTVAEGFQVIVVDDGSSDGCQRYFKQAEYMATVLHHSENKGKGAALKTGFARIASMCEADDVVVTLDADGQHTIQDAIKVCAEACIHPDSLILGSRALADNVPLRSRLGNTLVLSLLVEILGVNRLVAKLITELFFFVISYLVQRNGIFKKARKGVWSNVY